MKRTIISFLVVVLISAPSLQAQVLQKLSGLAVSVNAELCELHVRFEHPVTGEEIFKVFMVPSNTGFKNAKRLSDIKPNDPVSVDYEENADGPRAVYIEVVPLEKVPFDSKQVKRFFR